MNLFRISQIVPLLYWSNNTKSYPGRPLKQHFSLDLTADCFPSLNLVLSSTFLAQQMLQMSKSLTSGGKCEAVEMGDEKCRINVEQESDGQFPLVLQCSECNLIVGDSKSWVSANNSLKSITLQWRIQDFPEGGREPSRGGVNTPNFPENCMKSKEFGRPGGACVPHAPPRSANALKCECLTRRRSRSKPLLLIFFLPPANEVSECCVFTPVCHSVHRGE